MLVASALLFGAMAFTAKLASREIRGAEIAMIRFAICLVPIFLVPAWRRAALDFRRVDLLFYRGFFGGIAVLLYFMAIEHIPVGIATLLNYTAPLFSGLFAALFIGEPVRRAVIIPFFVAFIGVVLVIRSHAQPGDAFGFGVWEACGLASAMLSGAAVTAIRIARRTEGSWAIFASFSLFGLLATAPVGLWQWETPTLVQWGLLLAVGLLSIAAQLFMTSALRWVETLTAGVISQLAVITSMVLGALWLGEHLTTGALAGSALTIAGVIAVMAVSSTRSRSAAFDEAAEQCSAGLSGRAFRC